MQTEGAGRGLVCLDLLALGQPLLLCAAFIPPAPHSKYALGSAEQFDVQANSSHEKVDIA
jgi:hypothetical protein